MGKGKEENINPVNVEKSEEKISRESGNTIPVHSENHKEETWEQRKNRELKEAKMLLVETLVEKKLSKNSKRIYIYSMADSIAKSPEEIYNRVYGEEKFDGIFEAENNIFSAFYLFDSENHQPLDFGHMASYDQNRQDRFISLLSEYYGYSDFEVGRKKHDNKFLEQLKKPKHLLSPQLSWLRVPVGPLKQAIRVKQLQTKVFKENSKILKALANPENTILNNELRFEPETSEDMYDFLLACFAITGEIPEFDTRYTGGTNLSGSMHSVHVSLGILERVAKAFKFKLPTIVQETIAGEKIDEATNVLEIESNGKEEQISPEPLKEESASNMEEVVDKIIEKPLTQTLEEPTPQDNPNEVLGKNIMLNSSNKMEKDMYNNENEEQNSSDSLKHELSQPELNFGSITILVNSILYNPNLADDSISRITYPFIRIFETLENRELVINKIINEANKAKCTPEILWLAGCIYEKGKQIGLGNNYKEEALKFYNKAAELEYLPGLYSVGQLHEKIGTEGSAIKNYEASASNGYMPAQFHIAHYFSVNANHQEAFKWWSRLAEQGNDERSLKVAEYYMFGYGVSQDHTKALEIYIDCYRNNKENFIGVEALKKIGTIYAINQLKKDHTEEQDLILRAIIYLLQKEKLSDTSEFENLSSTLIQNINNFMRKTDFKEFFKELQVNLKSSQPDMTALAIRSELATCIEEIAKDQMSENLLNQGFNENQRTDVPPHKEDNAPPQEENIPPKNANKRFYNFAFINPLLSIASIGYIVHYGSYIKDNIFSVDKWQKLTKLTLPLTKKYEYYASKFIDILPIENQALAKGLLKTSAPMIMAFAVAKTLGTLAYDLWQGKTFKECASNALYAFGESAAEGVGGAIGGSLGASAVVAIGATGMIGVGVAGACTVAGVAVGYGTAKATKETFGYFTKLAVNTCNSFRQR
ncbi:MAG: tetratricopeptide repeat protein [Alphaproteobacteria bacterium]